MVPAKHMNDVMGKMATLDRAHQEYEKQAARSKDEYEFLAYPDSLKENRLVEHSSGRYCEHMKKSTNLDFSSATVSMTSKRW